MFNTPCLNRYFLGVCAQTSLLESGTALEKDVGKDAEQVELLARKFELFKEDVASNVTRVNRCDTLSLLGTSIMASLFFV